jgi:hypothetical protein
MSQWALQFGHIAHNIGMTVHRWVGEHFDLGTLLTTLAWLYTDESVSTSIWAHCSQHWHDCTQMSQWALRFGHIAHNTAMPVRRWGSEQFEGTLWWEGKEAASRHCGKAGSRCWGKLAQPFWHRRQTVCAVLWTTCVCMCVWVCTCVCAIHCMCHAVNDMVVCALGCVCECALVCVQYIVCAMLWMTWLCVHLFVCVWVCTCVCAIHCMCHAVNDMVVCALVFMCMCVCVICAAWHSRQRARVIHSKKHEASTLNLRRNIAFFQMYFNVWALCAAWHSRQGALCATTIYVRQAP